MSDSKSSVSSSSSGNTLLARSATLSDWYKPDPRKMRPSFQNSHQLVTLYAGHQEEAKSFLIHKDFACHYSPVLKAALDSDFIEGQTQSYRLDEENGEAVRLLVHWFYTQILDTRQPEEDLRKDLEEDLEESPKKDEDLALVHLWVLADKLIIPVLQNLVIDRIDDIREVTEIVPTAVLGYVYENTSAGSPLSRWFVYQCITQLEADCFTKHPEHFPQQILIEMAAFWSRNMPEDTKIELMEKVNNTDFEVEDVEEESVGLRVLEEIASTEAPPTRIFGGGT